MLPISGPLPGHHYLNKETQSDIEREGSKMATKADKANYRYTDFYCFMSLSDFTAYISHDDVDGEDYFSISTSHLSR